MTPNRRSGSALVIGGSLAGLLAARVLSDHFARVLVVERDPWPEDDQPRRGVPQGRHAHGVLNRGWQIMSRLFPDLEDAMREAGACWLDMGENFWWHHFGCWKVRFTSGISGPLMTRPFLEWQIAKRVGRLPNVEILDRCAVAQLAASQDRRRITGVHLEGRADAGQQIEADLVVDASGRGSRLPQWLQSLGYEPPPESLVTVNVGYATRLYAAPPGKDLKALVITPRPPLKRGAALFRVERERFLLTLLGWCGDHPPLDDAGFREFARSLPVPDVFEAMETLQPLTTVAQHRFPSNRRRHYEKLSRFPDGLIVVGDSVCSFNPTYGQGMTVSAIEAAALEDVLRSGSVAALGRFRKAVAPTVDIAWQLATGEDLRYEDVDGPRPFPTKLIQKYIGKLHEATSHDQWVAQQFFEVMHMLQPPGTLFRPAVMRRVLASRGMAAPPQPREHGRSSEAAV